MTHRSKSEPVPNRGEVRDQVLPKLVELYQSDPDPGIHGAAEWLLRQWKQLAKLKEIDKQLATGKVEGERRFYVNKQGQTFVVFSGPVEFLMGSPSTEAGRMTDEGLHPKRIPRSFAISVKEVTVESYGPSEPKFNRGEIQRWSPDPDCAVVGIVLEKNARVLRGGSFYVRPANVWSAFRGRYQPASRGSDFGFRAAWTYR